MEHADINFLNVKRMLLHFPTLILRFCGQPSRCFAGTSLLPFRLFLIRILKFWSIGVTLMKITWANHSKRWILVSNVSMTHDGFLWIEHTSFVFVCLRWDLPQNRWGLRRLHILKYATQLSCTFQHSNCTFVTILFGPFARLFINLAMRIRALFPKPATTLGLVEQAFWRMPFFHRMNCASSFEVIPCRVIETFFHWDRDFGFSTLFAHSAA